MKYRININDIIILVNPDTFVAPTAEIDALLSQGLSRAEIAGKLGITNKNFLKGGLVRIDIEAKRLKTLGLKATTGAEAGANEAFVAGGETEWVVLLKPLLVLYLKMQLVLLPKLLNLKSINNEIYCKM